MKLFRAVTCAAVLGCILWTVTPAIVAQEAAKPRMEIEVITITDFAASPNAIKPKHGPFILTLINRARLAPADLVLDSPSVPPTLLATLTALMKLSSFGSVRRLDSVIDAPPGIYQLKWKATGAVWLTITIE